MLGPFGIEPVGPRRIRRVVHAVEQLTAAALQRVGDAAFAARLRELVQIGRDDEAHRAGLVSSRSAHGKARAKCRALRKLAAARSRRCSGQNSAASSGRGTQSRRTGEQRQGPGSDARGGSADTVPACRTCGTPSKLR
jgi:hypothetical protein